MIYVLPFDLYEDWKELMFAKEVAENIRCKMFKPDADVVAVVRCKDCRHCKFNSSAENYKCDRRGYFTESVAEDGFCNYGERKE